MDLDAGDNSPFNVDEMETPYKHEDAGGGEDTKEGDLNDLNDDDEAPPPPAWSRRSILRRGKTAATVHDVEASFQALSVGTGRINGLESIYNQLLEDHPTTIGKAISKKERETENLTASTLVYGEIQFKPFALAFEKIKRKYNGLQTPGGVFYDLGSGTGKPVFAALLLHEWDKCVGVEMLKGLHKISVELLERWTEQKEELGGDSADGGLTDYQRKTAVEFLCADVTEHDWSDADVAFANSTCYDEALMRKLAEKAELLKPGTFFVTFTKRLPSSSWKVLEYERHVMSWGEATVYIQQKSSKTAESPDKKEGKKADGAAADAMDALDGADLADGEEKGDDDDDDDDEEEGDGDGEGEGEGEEDAIENQDE